MYPESFSKLVIILIMIIACIRILLYSLNVLHMLPYIILGVGDIKKGMQVFYQHFGVPECLLET